MSVKEQKTAVLIAVIAAISAGFVPNIAMNASVPL
jgi:hypothetical protein